MSVSLSTDVVYAPPFYRFKYACWVVEIEFAKWGVALLAVVIAIGITPGFPDILLTLVAAVLTPFLLDRRGWTDGVESVELNIFVFHLSCH